MKTRMLGGGGTEGSESGTQTDQQSVVQMVASMNVSNRLTRLIDSLPVTNEFNYEGCDDLNRKPPLSSKKAKVGPPPKIKNSTNRVRANSGLSISRLCDSIAQTSESMAVGGTKLSSSAEVSQMMVMQVFQAQMQSQERKIEAIENQFRMLTKVMSKMIKSNKKSRNREEAEEKIKIAITWWH